VLPNTFKRLTPQRIEILHMIRIEGAVSAGDVAEEICKRNKRTAYAQLKALHRLGLIESIRHCEYRISTAGDAWLDARVAPEGR
jgi:Fe2+ or Zn2+ uptake regulation protein